MPTKSILLAASFLVVALGVTFTISSAYACCKEQFTRSKPHVNVSSNQSQQNTVRTAPLWGLRSNDVTMKRGVAGAGNHPDFLWWPYR
jgi:hypothetical protein